MKGLELNKKTIHGLFEGKIGGMQLYELMDAFRGLIPEGAELRHVSFDIRNVGVVVLYEEAKNGGDIPDAGT